MHTGNSIIMQASREAIFETAADLEQWPRILPHYRYIRFLERAPDRSIVEMAALRSGIPISWTSEFVVDRDRMELRFLHLKAFTRGMRVVWTFKETPAGVVVEIMHALRFRIAALAPIAEPIIGGFFIRHVANQTLRAMKAHLEEQMPDNPNLEFRSNFQMTKIQKSKQSSAGASFRISDFGFVSTFDIRHSNFPPMTARCHHRSGSDHFRRHRSGRFLGRAARGEERYSPRGKFRQFDV